MTISRTSVLLLAVLLVTSLAWTQAPSPVPPVRIILVGDSTMAVRSGWGPAFCADVLNEVTCINRARGGRSSGSFRAEGLWTQVMDELKNNAAFKTTYVLIQFGHNDQPGKPGRSTDLQTEFPVNLRNYVREVKAAGAKPVLITALTRRWFVAGRVRNDLEPWAEATRKIAAEESVPLLDLNAESVAAVQKMGPVEANTLAMAPPPPEVAATAASGNSAPAPKPPTPAAATAANALPDTKAPETNKVERQGEAKANFDYTHLGQKGAELFGRMVANELTKAVPELEPYIKPAQ